MEAVANDILKQYLPEAKFKDEQWETIKLLLEGKQVLLIQPTGWGKSLVYFMTTRLLRDQGKGLTIIISPLLSLIRDQIKAAKSLGLNAYTLNSNNEDEWSKVNEAIQKNKCDLLFVAPERLENQFFKEEILPSIEKISGLGLIVVDEAHCISDWGHDFRPKYRKIISFVNQLEGQIPMLATTATANKRVEIDIAEQLGNKIEILRGTLIRENLKIKIVPLVNSIEKRAWLATHLDDLEGSGIIYCTTKNECERVTAWLKSRGIEAEFYHSKAENKEDIESRLINNKIKVVVATIALGMGFDKKDVRFVIHYNLSKSLIEYYQEIGRAGRDGKQAEIILLYSHSDIASLKRLINSGINDEKDYHQVLALIKDGGKSIYDILKNYNLAQNQVNKIIDLLMAEKVIYKDGTKYYESANIEQVNFLKNKKIKEHKLNELRLISNFGTYTDGCLMDYIIRHLGESNTIRCGLCQNCLPEDSSPLYSLDSNLINEVEKYDKNEALIIVVKSKWPSGGAGNNKGKINKDYLALEGRALCLYQDGGLGELIRKERYEDVEFSDYLVEKCADYISNNMDILNNPTWLTPVPSLRNPNLVPDFTKKLAEKLGLEYKQVISKEVETPEQKNMKNSNMQAANILEAFCVNDELLEGPVLLIDDIMNSGWTFTICAKKLKEAGCKSVTPFALAKT